MKAYSIPEIYKKVHTGKVRRVLSTLIFQNPIHKTMILDRKKKKPIKKVIYKIRLCRTFANKTSYGHALTKEQGKERKIKSFKYNLNTRKHQKDFADNIYSQRTPFEQLTNKGDEFRIHKAKGYYPHIHWNGEWCPLYMNVHKVYNRITTKDDPVDIVLQWRHGKSGIKLQKRSVRVLINKRIALANEKPAKTTEAQARPNGHCIIDIKKNSFDGLRGNSHKASKSFNMEV